MAEASWPLPPNAVVSDTQYEQLRQGYTASGVMGSPGDTGIITAPGSGTRIITVRLGKYALVRGHMWYSGTSDVNLASLASNGSGNPRIDLVTLRYTRSTGAVEVKVTTGTPAASPVPPTPTQTLSTSGVFEIPIAQVAVAAGATTITTGNITSRETYLQRVPLLGSAAPTTATPGVYVGQPFHAYDSTAGTMRSWWWNGSAWRAPAETGGLVGRGQRSTSSTTTTTTEVGVLRVDNLALPAGRRYLFVTSPVIFNSTVAADLIVFTLRINTAGTATTSSTRIMDLVESSYSASGPQRSQSLIAPYSPSGAETVSALLSVARTSGTGTVGILVASSPLHDIRLDVFDIGIDPGDTGVDV